MSSMCDSFGGFFFNSAGKWGRILGRSRLWFNCTKKLWELVMTSHVELTGDAFPPIFVKIYFRKIFLRKWDFPFCFLVRVQLCRVAGREMWTKCEQTCLFFGRIMSVAAFKGLQVPPVGVLKISLEDNLRMEMIPTLEKMTGNVAGEIEIWTLAKCFGLMGKNSFRKLLASSGLDPWIEQPMTKEPWASLSLRDISVTNAACYNQRQVKNVKVSLGRGRVSMRWTQ